MVELKKGQQLWVKAPPYYDKEYLYEVVSAGESQVRTKLYRSPKVKKSWSQDELELLLKLGIIRIGHEDKK